MDAHFKGLDFALLAVGHKKAFVAGYSRFDKPPFRLLFLRRDASPGKVLHLRSESWKSLYPEQKEASDQ